MGGAGQDLSIICAGVADWAEVCVHGILSQETLGCFSFWEEADEREKVQISLQVTG